jgi:hypothetical protein
MCYDGRREFSRLKFDENDNEVWCLYREFHTCGHMQLFGSNYIIRAMRNNRTIIKFFIEVGRSKI